jgi:MFS superfamily sulfate permease-like transporter
MDRGKTFGRDLSASFLVFLVALPLCLGIAIASGVPPARGLVTGIIGGIVTGALAGAPLAVSGPAAGLTVLIFELVNRHGLAMLGPIVLVAGLLQVAAGIARIGGAVRLMPPAIVDGMLAAIGLILAAGQIHVMLGAAPAPGFIPNMLHLPATFAHANLAALGIGLLSIAGLLAWERAHPRRLADIPGALIGVLAATAAASLLHLDVARIGLPASLAEAVCLPTLASLHAALNPAMLGAALSVALIASVESLLSAAAVDRMTVGRKSTDYSRELIAQGAGNMLCGVAGALPMTGVIVRSAANVRAGARTRLSAILHGVWLLGLVALAPGLLRLVPTASLAGLLVVVGLRLVNPGHIRVLARDGRLPVAVYAITLVTILATNLLTGVIAGVLCYAGSRALPRLIRRPV